MIGGKILLLRLDQIRLDGATQMRLELDSAVAAEYAEFYRQKDDLPDPVVFFDGSSYWLADGFHRWHGMHQAGIKSTMFKVLDGTARDAFLFACGTNRSHGLRRRPEDVRYCVRRLLQDEVWSRWSDRDIAAKCRCSHPIVGDERRKLKEEMSRKQAREESSLETISSEEGAARSAQPEDNSCRVHYTTKHGTTSTMDTAKIGSKNKARERPAYRIDGAREPEVYAKKLAQLARSRKKHARQSLEIGESEGLAVAAFLEVRRAIPVED